MMSGVDNRARHHLQSDGPLPQVANGNLIAHWF
jgi:hypothetical protein